MQIWPWLLQIESLDVVVALVRTASQMETLVIHQDVKGVCIIAQLSTSLLAVAQPAHILN